MTDIMVETVDFVQRQESSAVKQAMQAVKALHDALALKREIRLPVLDETREAIRELEDQIPFSETGIAALTAARTVDVPRHG